MNTIRICPICSTPLPPDAPAGLCPVCLLKTDPAAKPAAKAKSSEPASTLTISPEAFMRVRYFGDYELQEEIARGGMGVVWKARQSSLNRTVALKMILAGKLASEAEVQRFHREAEAAANLQHPNIVAIHEVGQHDGQHYYSMDYVEGRDLGALVRESGPLPPARAAQCLQTIAEAVHFAHQRGTLHRDLKPQNVLMDASGVPRITDFGLAKFVERDDSLTQTGATMGSPSYMPPEQAAGHLDQVGPHSDVYSLGAILYELLTGRPPFRAETAMATMRQVMESEPVAPRKLNPAVPPDLETICLKCLEKNPARRYPSARSLAEELARFLKHEPIQALPVSAVRKAENWLRRHPWTLMTAASLIALVLMGLLDWQYERVKFLENRTLVADKTLRVHLLGQELEPWNDADRLGNVMITFAFVFFKLYRAKRVKQVSLRPTGYPRHRLVSQPVRIVCGLLSIAGLAFSVLYFAKLIRLSVWEDTQNFSRVAWVVPIFYFSFLLLYLVVRDYLQFVHGAPGRSFSAEQSESLRQAIRDSDTSSAIKLVRRAFPQASLVEARAYIAEFAREEMYRQRFPGASLQEVREGSDKYYAEYFTDLKAKHPEFFSAPKLWDLNWRLMGLSLLVEAVAFAVIWLMNPPVAPAARLLLFAEWFMSGAAMMLSLRVKSSWKRFLGRVLCLLLPIMVTPRFYPEGIFLVGFSFGAFLIVTGFTPKVRESTPNKGTGTFP